MSLKETEVSGVCAGPGICRPVGDRAEAAGSSFQLEDDVTNNESLHLWVRWVYKASAREVKTKTPGKNLCAKNSQVPRLCY